MAKSWNYWTPEHLAVVKRHIAANKHRTIYYICKSIHAELPLRSMEAIRQRVMRYLTNGQ